MTDRQRLLAADNIGLAHHVSREARRKNPDIAGELLSAALDGLCGAAMDWDETLGVPFGAFAAIVIANAMAAELRFLRLPRGYRRAGRRKGYPGTFNVDPAELDVRDDAGPEAIPADSTEAFESLLRRLRPLAAATLRAIYGDGLSNAAVARRRGVCREAVSAVHRRALAELRRITACG